MGASTPLLTGAAIGLTVAAAGMGFLAGQASLSGDRPAAISEQSDAATTTFSKHTPKHTFPVADEVAATDSRAQLLHALERPDSQRYRAVRRAMNAWLAVDGAAAIMAVRDDPEFGGLAIRMTQFALFAYPEIFVDHPSLLEGIPDASGMIAIAARAIVMFDPNAARGMLDTHLSGPIFRDAVLSAVNRIESTQQDPRAELQSIVAERERRVQVQRSLELVARVAADDPGAASELIDDLPASLADPAHQLLVAVWSIADPEEAARWLVRKDVQISPEGLSQVAQGWGQKDFEAANAFANMLTGRNRSAFLAGLAAVPHSLSKEELLGWMSRYEDDPAYVHLVMNVARRLGPEDPEAAIALIDEVDDQSARNQLAKTFAGMWAQDDPESALDWALGLSPGRTRDHAVSSIAPSLTGLGLDRTIGVINEIEDPRLRLGTVRQLLFTLEADDDAIRLGRDYGLDRDQVLEIREKRMGKLGAGPVRTISSTYRFRDGAGTEE